MTLDPSPRQRATLQTRHGKPETLMWCWKGCPHKPPFHSMVNSSLAFAPQSNGAAHHTERLPWKEALHITVLRRAIASPAPNTREAGEKPTKTLTFLWIQGLLLKRRQQKRFSLQFACFIRTYASIEPQVQTAYPGGNTTSSPGMPRRVAQRLSHSKFCCEKGLKMDKH